MHLKHINNYSIKALEYFIVTIQVWITSYVSFNKLLNKSFWGDPASIYHISIVNENLGDTFFRDNDANALLALQTKETFNCVKENRGSSFYVKIVSLNISRKSFNKINKTHNGIYFPCVPGATKLNSEYIICVITSHNTLVYKTLTHRHFSHTSSILQWLPLKPTGLYDLYMSVLYGNVSNDDSVTDPYIIWIVCEITNKLIEIRFVFLSSACICFDVSRKKYFGKTRTNAAAKGKSRNQSQINITNDYSFCPVKIQADTTQLWPQKCLVPFWIPYVAKVTLCLLVCVTWTTWLWIELNCTLLNVPTWWWYKLNNDMTQSTCKIIMNNIIPTNAQLHLWKRPAFFFSNKKHLSTHTMMSIRRNSLTETQFVKAIYSSNSFCY